MWNRKADTACALVPEAAWPAQPLLLLWLVAGPYSSQRHPTAALYYALMFPRNSAVGPEMIGISARSKQSILLLWALQSPHMWKEEDPEKFRVQWRTRPGRFTFSRLPLLKSIGSKQLCAKSYMAVWSLPLLLQVSKCSFSSASLSHWEKQVQMNSSLGHVQSLNTAPV